MKPAVIIGGLALAILTGCASPRISQNDSRSDKAYTASVPPLGTQSENRLSGGLTKEEQYLEKYRQLVPTDTAPTADIVSKAKTFCDQPAPAATATDTTAVLTRTWQQLMCPK